MLNALLTCFKKMLPETCPGSLLFLSSEWAKRSSDRLYLGTF